MSKERALMIAAGGTGLIGAGIYAMRGGKQDTSSNSGDVGRHRAQGKREMGLSGAAVGGNAMTGGPETAVTSASPGRADQHPERREVTTAKSRDQLPSGGVGGGEGAGGSSARRTQFTTGNNPPPGTGIGDKNGGYSGRGGESSKNNSSNQAPTKSEPSQQSALWGSVQQTFSGKRTTTREEEDGSHDTRGISKMGPETTPSKRGPAEGSDQITTRHNFTFNISPSRVLFGQGKVQDLPAEVSRQGLDAVVVLTTPRQTERGQWIMSLLGAKAAGIFSEATMHTPVNVTEKAVEYVRSVKADSVVSFGGGSTVGLGKAISVRTGIPHICIPTTYAGSEMTAILGETVDGLKKTRSDPKILPGTVIYDVDLTMTLSPEISATSGINAMAHAVEALYAENANPVISLLALEAIRVLAESLPIVVRSPDDVAARSAAQYGSWLCGLCLGSVGMSLHHKLCHTLGGSFGLPHAETHTIVLAHALAYNAPSVPDVMAKLAVVLPDSNGDAIRGLNHLLTKLNVKRGLREFGFKETDVDKAVDIALSNPYYNPRKVEREPLRELIRRVYAGEPAKGDL